MSLKTYTVTVPVIVAARNGVEAVEFALEDLREGEISAGDFEVKQTGGPHEPVTVGLCPVCLHFGSDCTGDAA